MNYVEGIGMANRKMIMSNLVKNSIAAYYAAIEIHNKPNISFRYETVTLLLNNAWELILKAFIRKYMKKTSIFSNDKHTIPLKVALEYVSSFINAQKPKSFIAIRKNIEEVENYRNKIAHFYNEQLEPYIFMLVAKSAINYVDFIKQYFNKDVMNIDRLFIMPLGFKLPFRPEDFLSKKAVDSVSSKESKMFINNIIRIIQDLNKQGIDESIVIGFDIYFESVKKCSNSDLLAAITKIEDADVTFSKIINYRLTNDPNAQVMTMNDEEFRKIWKHRYQDVVDFCRENIVNFKKNQVFNSFMKDLKNDVKYSYTKKLDNKNPSSASQIFYTDLALEKLRELYGKTKLL